MLMVRKRFGYKRQNNINIDNNNDRLGGSLYIDTHSHDDAYMYIQDSEYIFFILLLVSVI